MWLEWHSAQLASLLPRICHLKEKHYLCAVFRGARVGHKVSTGTVLIQ